MFVVIWQYEVREGHDAAFEALYGDAGEWIALFREHDGYLGTELLRDAGQARRFVTIDRWSSAENYTSFLTAAKPRYAQIDARGDALTLTERCLGRFTTV